jgi:hypothetical protein
VDAARNAVDARSPDHDRVRAFSDALDGLENRLDTLEKLASLDRRHANLAAWAAERRRAEIAADARLAASRAKITGDAGALRAYESALDALGDILARSAGPSGRPLPGLDPAGPKCTDPNDPLCGFNGRPL